MAFVWVCGMYIDKPANHLAYAQYADIKFYNYLITRSVN